MVEAAQIVPNNLTVVLDVPTRWNSTYSMLKRAERLRQPIDMFLNSNPLFKEHLLSADEWSLLKELLAVLKPLDDITNYLSKSKFPTLSTVIPAYSGCIEEIQCFASTSSSIINAQVAIEAKIGVYKKKVDANKVYKTATILDPRFKLCYFKGSKEYPIIKQQFISDVKEFSEKLNAESGNPVAAASDADAGKSSDDAPWITRMFKKAKMTDIEEEIRTYLSEPQAFKNSDPLKYWEEKEEIFPSLSTMAKKFLTASATSTPSERSFSGGRLVCDYTRGSLSSEKLCALICLNSWVKHGYGK